MDCNKVPYDKGWTLVGSQTGHNNIALPSIYKELHVKVCDTATGVSFVFNILKEDMPSSGSISFRSGYSYQSGTYYAMCAVGTDATNIWVDDIRINSSQPLSTTAIEVYYK